MSLLTVASMASVERGYYIYLKKNMISNINKINDNEYTSNCRGSNNEIYDVYINLKHARKGKCTCKKAEGGNVVCKHQIALYFTLFNEEADRYLKEEEEREEEYYREYEEMNDRLFDLLYKLKKEELICIAEELLMDAPDWVKENILRSYER